jgi:hypothetical protein
VWLACVWPHDGSARPKSTPRAFFSPSRYKSRTFQQKIVVDSTSYPSFADAKEDAVPEYLIMIREDAATTPADAARRFDGHRAFAARIANATLDTGKLRPRGEGMRVTRGAVEHGCFDDAFDRYYWMRADDVAHAATLASEIPLAGDEHVEVRPLIEGKAHADKLDRPGKLFAFSVLAAAPDEATWTALMETIAKETADTLSPDQFAGGLRLRPPSTGKRIVLDKTRRRVLDGPFLESKEVIGGLFFLRASGLDEAVRWASASRFLAHGALEIRELWRM